MQVASLELCKTLHELSGWSDTHHWWSEQPHVDGAALEFFVDCKPSNEARWSGAIYIPAYELGYLLRKLPNYIEYWNGGNESGYLQLIHFSSHWSAGYEDQYESGQSLMQHLNDTPEDAVTKLTIELFKQNILTKET